MLTNTDLNIKELFKEQKDDLELKDITKDSNNQLNLKLIKIPCFNYELWCETSGNNPRSYVSKNLRKIVFEILHFISHPE